MITNKQEVSNPNFDSIPDEIKELRQWCVYKLKPNGEKMTKLPIDANTGKAGKSNDESTWSDFDTAIEAVKKFNCDGIGFFFKPPYFGVDIDNVKEDIERFKCDDHDNNVVSKFIDSLCSYSEVSVSGNGIHIILKGELPGGARRKGNIEMYDSGRFFVMTGEQIGPYTKIAEDEDGKIGYLHSKYLKDSEATKHRLSTESHPPGTTLSEEEIIHIALRSRNGDRFKSFLEGGWDPYYESKSEADMAFLNDLAYWTNKDPHMMDSVYRKSSLMREKWDRKQNNSTYGEEHIQKAIAECTNTFDPRKEDFKYAEVGYFVGKKFHPKFLGEDILKIKRLLFDGNHLYGYVDGVYKPINDIEIKQICKEKLGKDFKKSFVEETIYYIKIACFREISDFNPDTKFINVKNGLLDWKERELHPHTPDFISTIQIPVEYKEDATCQSIHHFFGQVMPEDTISLAYEWFGYSLLPTTKFEKALMLTGGGSNGKSKFIGLYERFIGTDNISSIPLQDLEQNRFKLAHLFGKLANTFADISAKALEKSSVFKTVVSGDRTSAEFKNRDSFDFKPFARLLFSANELPSSTDLTDGFFRRWLIIPFPNKFGEGGMKKDPNILTRLTTDEELSGLLNGALDGLERLEANNGFTENETTRRSIEQFRKEIDNVVSFVEEQCVISEEAIVDRQYLFDLYCKWCSERGYKALGKNTFYSRIDSQFSERDFRPAGMKRHFKGIGIAP